jgi:ABC-type sugar transport system substrate-binding protein
MSQNKVALFLVERSDFQELLRHDAEAAAKKAGIGLDTYFTGHDFAAQLTQIRDCINSAAPPGAILVLAVRDHGLARTVREAVKNGISFVFLNRTDDDLNEARTDAAGGATVSEVCADEIETGRIQGRQFRKLLPEGGKVLYIQGSTRSLSARDRTNGMKESVEGSNVDVTLVEAGWGLDEARLAVHHRLTLLGRIRARVDLIGCHTDQIAQGTLQALDQAAAELGRPELARIPVTGCDASPTLGQRLVQSGRLAASISLPRTTANAIEAFAKQLQGAPMPPTILFKPASFPTEDKLAPLVRQA